MSLGSFPLLHLLHRTAYIVLLHNILAGALNVAMDLGHWAKWMRLSLPGDDCLHDQAGASCSIVYGFSLQHNINPPPSWGSLTWGSSLYSHPDPSLSDLGSAGVCKKWE